MKIAVAGRKTKAVSSKLSRNGFTLSAKPEIIFCHGGDGTVLYAERLYPSVPKLPVRGKTRCKTCAVKTSRKIHFATHGIYCESALGEIISRLKKRKFKTKEISKVEGIALVKRNGRTARKTLVGLNEVQVHNSNHAHAVRFDFCVNGVCLHDEIIGDGVVVSTSHGATAYFYAITKKKFGSGFGIAFNNAIRQQKPLFYKGKFEADVTIHRRHAVLVADNNPKTIALKEGDKVVFRPSKEKARLIVL